MNEEKHKWNEYPFDQHSLAPSRLDTGALSDGGYSDGTPEFEREDSSSKKTKKKFLGVKKEQRNVLLNFLCTINQSASLL